MKIILLVTVFCFLFICANGQTRPLTPPLRFSVEVKDIDVCLGKSIEVITTLKNISKDEVAIDTNPVGSLVVFDRIIYKGGKIIKRSIYSENGAPPSHYRPDVKILRPLESFIKKVTYPLSPKIFVAGSFLRMQTGYDQILTAAQSEAKLWRGTLLSKPVLVRVRKCLE